MSHAVDAAVLAVFLIVGLWVVLFGTTAAVLNRDRDGSAVTGALMGVCFGPLALLWIVWRRRDDAAGPGRLTPAVDLIRNRVDGLRAAPTRPRGDDPL